MKDRALTPSQRFALLLSLLFASLIFLVAAKMEPKPKVDVVELKVTPLTGIAPAEFNIHVKVENPNLLWCPKILITIESDDGYPKLFSHSQESDCDPSEESEPHESWSYFFTPMKGTRTRIFGPGIYKVTIALLQGKTIRSQSLTVNVI